MTSLFHKALIFPIWAHKIKCFSGSFFLWKIYFLFNILFNSILLILNNSTEKSYYVLCNVRISAWSHMRLDIIKNAKHRSMLFDRIIYEWWNDTRKMYHLCIPWGREERDYGRCSRNSVLGHIPQRSALLTLHVNILFNKYIMSFIDR